MNGKNDFFDLILPNITSLLIQKCLLNGDMKMEANH